MDITRARQNDRGKQINPHTFCNFHNHYAQNSPKKCTHLHSPPLGRLAGEIVQLQGGHIVRPTSRKDRHSKVCTAKGPRDRRVRLSAHTAIQFYDVQDRLGCDRPSKAVDWLIDKAKLKIDQLPHLPPWNPLGNDANKQNPAPNFETNGHHESQLVEDTNFLDSYAIKSLFPTGASSSSSSLMTSMQFQNYPDFTSTPGNSQTQDLRLSLHSFGDPNFLQQSEETMFARSGATWSEHQSGEISGGGFMFSSEMYGQNHLFSQRAPLHSSYTPSVRGWLHTLDHQYHQIPPVIENHPLISGIGFHIPVGIRGEEEHVRVNMNNPSSVSSDSQH